MESLHRLPKLQMVYVFTAGKSLVVISFESFSTVYFSNPPSYGYTVKETGEKFTSCHENRIEAYKEYLSLKTKKENL